MNEFPEVLCWCLIATMATFIAVVREDAFFTALFAALSGFALTIAMRRGFSRSVIGTKGRWGTFQSGSALQLWLRKEIPRISHETGSSRYG